MVPSRSTSNDVDRPHRFRTSFGRDDRAIEGLPIRLVIALTVGVAALALMLSMLGDIGDVGDTEVTIEIVDDELIEAGATGADGAVKVEVIDENGNNVPDATVVATADSAQLDGVVRAETGTDPSIGGYSNLEDNEAVLVFDGDQDLRADQDLGEIELEIIPPSDSNYIDEQPNPDIRVASSL